jgi:hypothetical protein
MCIEYELVDDVSRIAGRNAAIVARRKAAERTWRPTFDEGNKRRVELWRLFLESINGNKVKEGARLLRRASSLLWGSFLVGPLPPR